MSSEASNKDKILNNLEALKLSYQRRLRDTAAELSDFIKIINDDGLSDEEYERMTYVVHGLAGSGTTFGFPEISQKSRALNDMLLAKDKSFAHISKQLKEIEDACLKGFSNQISRNEAPDFIVTEKRQDYHVMIVDDDPQLAEFLKIQIQKRNILVSAASNAQEAMECLKQFTPDLIVLDVMMPGMSGYDFLKLIKKDPKYKNLRVIMLTSRQNQHEIADALNSGAIHYIVKPFKPEHLLVKIEEILSASRKNIMIIESDPLIIELLEHIYTEHGFNVTASTKGMEAWKAISSSPPDLIIIDWMLPNMDALTIMKNLKQNAATEKIPVIVLSSEDKAEDPSDISSIKISKPFIPRDLIKRSLAILDPA